MSTNLFWLLFAANAVAIIMGIVGNRALRKRQHSRIRHLMPFAFPLVMAMSFPLRAGSYKWGAPTIDVAPSVQSTTPTNIHQVTVREAPSVLLSWIIAQRHDDRTNEPPETTTSEQSNVDTAQTSRLEAVVAAARYIDRAASLTGTGITLIAVPPSSELRVGDVITAVNGRRVYTRTDLYGSIYDTTATSFEIATTRQEMSVKREQFQHLEGISSTDFGSTLKPIRDNNSEGGDSAGLAFALGILIKDRVLPSPQCRTVVTGAIAYDGRVVAISGTSHKVASAVRSHACLLIVPRANYREAQRSANERIRVVPVCTLDEAIVALRAPFTQSIHDSNRPCLDRTDQQ